MISGFQEWATDGAGVKTLTLIQLKNMLVLFDLYLVKGNIGMRCFFNSMHQK